jgi:hypothetical protein
MYVLRLLYAIKVLSSDTKLDVEVATRGGQGLGAFAQFERVWGNKHLKLNTKM